MIDFLWDLLLLLILGYIALELGLLVKYLQRKHMPVGRNEEPTDLEGTNEPEPKKGR